MLVYLPNVIQHLCKPLSAAMLPRPLRRPVKSCALRKSGPVHDRQLLGGPPVDS